ncbi:hypothetical protein D3C71_1760470 [compost metagenome]
MTVHAARRQQAEQVHRAAAAPGAIDQVEQRRIGGELAGGDRPVDAREVLVHHAAGAEVHVAHFGVAHLPLGQADGGPRGGDPAMRKALQQAVQGRRARRGQGVGIGLLTQTDAIQNNQSTCAHRGSLQKM